MRRLTVRTVATQEQKDAAKAKRQKMQSLCRQLEAMSPEQRAEFSAKLPYIATVEGRALSMHNTALCYWQGFRGDGIVGGFQQWKRNGRCVRKGQHGFSIWVPIGRKTKEADGESTTEGTGFILATMFDLSQTCEIGAEELEAVA
jgi:hypothetical protein